MLRYYEPKLTNPKVLLASDNEVEHNAFDRVTDLFLHLERHDASDVFEGNLDTIELEADQHLWSIKGGFPSEVGGEVFKKLKNFDIAILDLNDSHDDIDFSLSYYLYSIAAATNCTIIVYHGDRDLSFACDTTQDLFGDYRDDEEFEDCLEFEDDEQLEMELG